MERVWTIGDVLKWTARRFAESDFAQPRLEAEVLLGHALGKDRVKLYTDYGQPLIPEELAAYRELVRQRLRGVPTAYLTGKKEFMSLSFKVNRDVLIPRPETELLVEAAASLARTGFRDREIFIVDVGTGTGAIAICLGRFLPQARVLGIDISPAALMVARENACLLRVADRVRFQEGDLLGPLLQGEAGLREERAVDMVTANLPYVPAGEIPSLPVEVRGYEPALALDGGRDGLDCYRRLVPEAARVLKPGGYLLAEIGAGQGKRARGLFVPEFWSEVTVRPDYAGRDRVLIARVRGEE
jgi:release factor glutamine methyltransferase